MVIIQKRVGQLGNQLFAIAHFTAAAIENDYRVLCPCFEHCLGEFPNINTNRNLKVLRAGRRTNRLVHGFFKFLRLGVPEFTMAPVLSIRRFALCECGKPGICRRRTQENRCL